MRIRDTIVLKSTLHAGSYVPGIVIGHKLSNSMNVVEAFEGSSDILFNIMIPHSFLVITQEGFYQVHHNPGHPGYQARRL